MYIPVLRSTRLLRPRPNQDFPAQAIRASGAFASYATTLPSHHERPQAKEGIAPPHPLRRRLHPPISYPICPHEILMEYRPRRKGNTYSCPGHRREMQREALRRTPGGLGEAVWPDICDGSRGGGGAGGYKVARVGEANEAKSCVGYLVDSKAANVLSTSGKCFVAYV